MAVVTVICIAAIWCGVILCSYLIPRWAPELMPWYPVYELAVGLIGTLMILAGAGLLE